MVPSGTLRSGKEQALRSKETPPTAHGVVLGLGEAVVPVLMDDIACRSWDDAEGSLVESKMMIRCIKLGSVMEPRRVEVENSGSRRDSSVLVSDARPPRPEAAASRCCESWSA